MLFSSIHHEHLHTGIPICGRLKWLFTFFLATDWKTFQKCSAQNGNVYCCTMIHLRLRVNLRSCSNRFLSDFPMHSFQDMCGLPVMSNTRSSKIRGDEHSTGGDTWWNDAVIKAQTMGKKQWRFRKNKNKMNWHRNTVLKYLGLPDRVVVKQKQKIFLTVPCNRKGLLYSFNEGHFLAIQWQLIRLY